jgi:hypothetical protein
MHFAHLLPPERLDAVLDQQLAELEHKLALIGAYESAQAGKPSCGASFVCGFGKAVMGAARNYIRAHRRELAQGEDKKTTNRSTRQARARSKTAQAASRNRGYTNA